MIPSPFADVPPLLYTDSVDIPVVFRDSPAARPFKQWRTAKPAPWPATAGFPAKNGWYLPTTTWREILKAATEVGRDITPNLLRLPQLASSELVARVAPLYAYLGTHAVDTKHTLAGSKGRRLTVNPVYEYGTERSAKNALGYRLGMTMAEWATRSLMGLGQTLHIEDGGPIPALRDKFVSTSAKLPDLWGLHEQENLYWMIEAKGGNVRGPRLWEGWKQLQGGSKVLHEYAHRRILVGASVQPQGDLFLTIDHDHHPGKPPLPPTVSTTGPQPPGSPEDHLGDSDDALMGTARAQMLVYLALSGAQPSRLKTVALPADRTNRRRSARGVTTPLERDTDAYAMRSDVRAEFADDAQPGRREYARALGLDDFLTYRVPGTELPWACPGSSSPPAPNSTERTSSSPSGPRACGPKTFVPTSPPARKPRSAGATPSAGSSGNSRRKSAPGSSPVSVRPSRTAETAPGENCSTPRTTRGSTSTKTPASSKLRQPRPTSPSAKTTSPTTNDDRPQHPAATPPRCKSTAV
ncbi:gamma-glutamyltransferase [Streptomyces sp. TN58]|uniref:gamma-glutamyltransferase n=1 Tax=Streptomyces sp. TN58 TaxID=234612 RepID=UPI000AD2D1B4|nr:gamma-glutamyltransferase [Streptomyces sp. TN58]